MATSQLTRSSRRVKAGASIGIAGLLTLLLANTVLGTAPVGTAGAPTTLANVIVQNTVNIDGEGTHFKTKDQVRVLHQQRTADAGWSSGWHEHTGPVILTILSGTFTFYDANCGRTTVTAGQGYIESTAEPVLARNESTTDSVTWMTTQIIPVDGALRVDVPGRCGLP
jgi:hypothetical protein